MILEAMKMQMPLLAPMSGKVIMKINLQCVHAGVFCLDQGCEGKRK